MVLPELARGRKSCNSGTLVTSDCFPAEKLLQLVDVGMTTRRFLRTDGWVHAIAMLLDC